MERALFVAQRDTPATDELLREAGELVAGVDAELIILHVMEEETYQKRSEAREGVDAPTKKLLQLGGYPLTQATDEAKWMAERLGLSALDDLNIDWLALGTVGREAESILEVAREYECDHIFTIGKRRSPSGKAIFGDLAQRLVLDFDGPVTILIPEERED